MKIEEYKTKIDGLLTNPDTALTGIGEVYEALEGDLTTRDSLASENEQLKKTVQELRETNIKLYMRSEGEGVQETIENETDNDEVAVNEFFNNILGVEKED